MILKLKTVSPLFIGKGQDETILKTNYYIDSEKNKAFILKKDLIEIFLEKGLNNKKIKQLIYKNKDGEKELLGLKEIIENVKNNENIDAFTKEKILKELDKHIVEIEANTKKESGLKEIKNFISLGKGSFNYYIPGSSLKGALRNYIILKILLNINPTLVEEVAQMLEKIIKFLRRNNKQFQLANIKVEKLSRYKQNKYKALENYLKLINNFLNGKSNNISDYRIKDYLNKNKFLYGIFNSLNFVISDSNILDIEDFKVIKINRVKKKSNKIEGVPNYILALSENKEAIFNLKIKKERKEKFLEFLANSIKEVNKKVFESYGRIKLLDKNFLRKLNELNEKVNENYLLINLGGLSGSKTKSIISLLNYIYPNSYNLTPDNKIIGWVGLKIEK